MARCLGNVEGRSRGDVENDSRVVELRVCADVRIEVALNTAPARDNSFVGAIVVDAFNGLILGVTDVNLSVGLHTDSVWSVEGATECSDPVSPGLQPGSFLPWEAEQQQHGDEENS